MRATPASVKFVALTLAACIGLCTGCAVQTPPVVQESDPMAREAHGLSGATISSTDGVVLAQVESAGIPSIRTEGTRYFVDIPIGSEVSVECMISPQWEAVATQIARQYTTMSADPRERRLLKVEPLVLLDRPALYVEMAAVREKQDGTFSVALYKMEAVAVGGTATILCSHQEVGFRDTFRRVVARLAGSVRLNDAGDSMMRAIRSSQPSYQHIAIERVETTPLGISESREFRSENGGGVIYARSFRLLPQGDPLFLAAMDQSAVEVSGPDGYVRNQELVRVTTNDGTGEDLSLWVLSRLDDGTYEIRNQSATGDKRERLGDGRSLPSHLQRGDIVAREIIGGRQDRLTFATWNPPERGFGEVNYQRLPTLTPGETRIERTEGGDKKIVVFDSAGCWTRSEPVEPSQLFGGAERVFARGRCTDSE